MNKPLSALLAGVIFGIGLSVSGMSNPQVVLAFLTVERGWDPSLLLVMASAVAVTAVGYLAIGKRATPLFDREFHIPVLTAIDGRLILGAAVFGAGWGLAGYCPGPAIVGAFTLDPRALVFLPGFIVGMLAFEGLPKPAPPQLQ